MSKGLKKGDTVLVITGADKTKSGVVLDIDRKRDRVVVEGVNVRRKTIRPTQENPQGGIIDKEMPIHVSNVKLQEQT
ncbi:MAG: 50S ribosomal protein L24 [Lentisphaeria bacterium]|nr:50S ribosomal protein L24 [Lentisphaeria bacterium]